MKLITTTTHLAPYTVTSTLMSARCSNGNRDCTTCHRGCCSLSRRRILVTSLFFSPCCIRGRLELHIVDPIHSLHFNLELNVGFGDWREKQKEMLGLKGHEKRSRE
ncbi:hypothetical protein ACFX13_038959 [Malus domestica]